MILGERSFQVYWTYIAPNEPGRVPENSPVRIARRMVYKTEMPFWFRHFDSYPLPPGGLPSWKRGVWA